MTSWTSYTRPRTVPTAKEELDVYFQTGTGGFCTQFNRYFYHAYYAKRIGKTLRVVDGPNCIADDYALLRSTFADVSGVTFVPALPADATDAVKQRQAMRLFDTLSKAPRETLRESAREILRWSSFLEAQIQGMLTAMGIPTQYDIGVHIRTGDKTPVPVGRYLRAVDDMVRARNLKKARIFVACDNPDVMAELEARTKDGPHEFVSFGGSGVSGGHFQKAFNAKTREEKYSEAMTFFVELYLLQRAPAIVCTLSSNVGKFLFLTAETVRNFKSLDLADLVPL